MDFALFLCLLKLNNVKSYVKSAMLENASSFDKHQNLYKEKLAYVFFLSFYIFNQTFAILKLITHYQKLKSHSPLSVIIFTSRSLAQLESGI